MAPRRSTARWLAAAAMVAAPFCWPRLSPAPLLRAAPAVPWHYALRGETLLHGLRVGGQDAAGSFYLPASTVGAALIFDHDARGGRNWNARFGAAALLLTGACAGLALPLPWAAAAPAFLAASALRDHGFYNYPYSLYTLMLAMVAGLLIWRGQSPTLRRTLLLALAIGGTLTFRSPLAFLPPALAAWEWRAGRRGLAKGLILLLVPYLFLAPWVRLQWLVHHRVALFERGEATPNIYRAALGEVRSADLEPADVVRLGGAAGVEDTAGVVAWSLREIARHPARYVAGFALRVWEVFLYFPAAFLALGAAAFFLRRRPEFSAVAALSGYYVLIHCTMAVLDLYFEPIRPLLAIGFAGLAAWLAGDAKARPADFARQACSWLLLAALAAELALAAYSGAAAWAFPSAGDARTDAGAAVEAAAAANPRDSWLLFVRGNARWNEGRLDEALADLEEATRLRPDAASMSLSLAAARAVRSGPRAILDWQPPAETPADSAFLPYRAGVMKARAWLSLGSPEQARSALGRALTEAGAVDCAPQPGWPRALRESLPWSCAAARALDRGALEEARAALEREDYVATRREFWRQLALTRRARGDVPGAASILRQLSGEYPRLPELKADLRLVLAPPSPRERRRAEALALQGKGDYARALARFDALVGSVPTAASLTDRGVCLYLSGRAEKAAADWRRALALDPGWMPAYASLGAALQAQGKPAEAAELYSAAAAFPRPSDVSVAAELRARLEALSKSASRR